MIYHSSKELEGTILKLNDRVVFTLKNSIIQYIVECNHLSIVGLLSNHHIFNKLDIPDSASFCRTYYNGGSCRGDFPECATHDFNSLTKVTIALYKIIETTGEYKLLPFKDKLKTVKFWD